jgi:hypothetical protein
VAKFDKEKIVSETANSAREISAVVGAWHRDGRTFYVKRSTSMENYPNVWSLLSIQFRQDEFPDFTDLVAAGNMMRKMAEERLGGVSIRLVRYAKSARCSDNPMGVPVTLHLYEIELQGKPILNPHYYVASEWFAPEEYVRASENTACGLCMRMWSDYCYERGLSKIRFAPSVRQDHGQYVGR